MNKQETLEEARLTYLKNRYYKSTDSESFIAGAKWQAERMYSEQEVFNILMDFFMEKNRQYKLNPVCVAEWFEQFKKK